VQALSVILVERFHHRKTRVCISVVSILSCEERFWNRITLQLQVQWIDDIYDQQPLLCHVFRHSAERPALVLKIENQKNTIKSNDRDAKVVLFQRKRNHILLNRLYSGRDTWFSSLSRFDANRVSMPSEMSTAVTSKPFLASGIATRPVPQNNSRILPPVAERVLCISPHQTPSPVLCDLIKIF